MKATQFIHDNLVEIFGSLRTKKILDYGCGRGGLIDSLYKQEELGPAYVLAVDSSEESLKYVRNTFSWLCEKNKLDVKKVVDPTVLKGLLFDGIFCHNVLECIKEKEQFVTNLYELLTDDGMMILSHHDFDSALYNSKYKEFTRNIIHHFADTKQEWQDYCDGQMGRKIPGILFRSSIENFEVKVIRIVERTFSSSNYGHLMASMILEVLVHSKDIDQELLRLWYEDLKEKAETNDYYFAIDLVTARARR